MVFAFVVVVVKAVFHLAADPALEILRQSNFFNLTGAHACRVTTSNNPTHRSAHYIINWYFIFFECLQYSDMCKPFRASSAQHQPHLLCIGLTRPKNDNKNG